MKVIFEGKFKFDSGQIDNISDKIAEVLESEAKAKPRDILRLRLAFEEAMLRWRDAELSVFEIIITKRFRRIELSVKCDGIRVEPFMKDKALGGGFDFASNFINTWQYRYRDGINCISCDIPIHKNGSLWTVAMALGAGVITSIILKLLPSVVMNVALDYVINPVFDTYLSFLKAIVSPMVFVSVICGIVNIGSPERFGRLGKTLLKSYIHCSVIFALFGVIGVCAVFGVKSGMGQMGSFKNLADIIYNIVPKDVFSPFIDGNTLQIVFLAAVIGIALLFIRSKVETIEPIISDINTVLGKVLSTLTLFLPIFIYLSVIRISTLEIGLDSLKPFGVALIADVCTMLVVTVIYFIAITLSSGISLKKSFHYSLPLGIMGLVTSSSAACFNSFLDTSSNKYRIDKRMTEFGVPIGVAIFKPCIAIGLTFFVTACFNAGGAQISFGELFTLFIIATLLSIASPPIPGGALACYTLLFAQFGIDISYLAIISAINVFIDMAECTFDFYIFMPVMAYAAKKTGYTDEE